MRRCTHAEAPTRHLLRDLDGERRDTEVDRIGFGGESDVHAVVHDDADSQRPASPDRLARDLEKRTPREVLLAHHERRQAALRGGRKDRPDELERPEAAVADRHDFDHAGAQLSTGTICYHPRVASVPILDLRAQYRSIAAEVREAVSRVFETQRFILGPELEVLEKEIAALAGARRAIGCASGSDAIVLAIASLLPPREAPAARGADPDRPEVVTVPFTFFASAGSVVHAGARPRFVDIEPEAYGMDPARVPAAITDRTVAVLPVHLFGQPCDLDAILRSAGRVPLVEDAAQAIGARYRGPTADRPARVVGSFGLIGCLSFFPTKNLGGAGDGGMILTSDEALAERLLAMRVHGGRQMYHHESVGWNSRLDEVQAAVLRVKLPHLASWSEARGARAARYDALLAEHGLVSRGLIFPPVRKPDREHVFHQYVVRVPKDGAGRGREDLRAALASIGVTTGVYYPVPLHLQPCFASLGHARGDFPVAERAAEEVLALPIYPELTADQQAYVVRGIASHFGLA